LGGNEEAGELKGRECANFGGKNFLLESGFMGFNGAFERVCVLLG